MRLTSPRITPLTESEWSEDQRRVLEPRRDSRFYNVLGTVARHWEASRKMNVWTDHIMGETNTLIPRHRELLILRIGWLCRAEYEWGQHVMFGREAGLTEAEIAAVKEGPDHVTWTDLESALLCAADELHVDAFISDETWDRLAQELETLQLMDVVFTVGRYNTVSMVLNTLGVQLDPGVKGF